MRINGYNPANRMTADRAGHSRDSAATGRKSGPAGADATAETESARLAPRLAPAAAPVPAGPDMRFMAQLIGQLTEPGERQIGAIHVYYERRPIDEDDRPYWADRPIKYLI
jgi:hypothetical protein